MQLKLSKVESKGEAASRTPQSKKKPLHYEIHTGRSFFLRPTSWILICFFISAGIWARCTEIDIVAVARGVVVDAQDEGSSDAAASSVCYEPGDKRTGGGVRVGKATPTSFEVVQEQLQPGENDHSVSAAASSTSGDHLEVDAYVLDRDIGFVRPGQAVDIKFDAIPAARYGVIKGYLKDIHTLKGRCCRESCFVARVSLPVESVTLDHQTFHLMSRMRVTVDIKIGTRKVSDFILAPLFRLRTESLHER